MSFLFFIEKNFKLKILKKFNLKLQCRNQRSNRSIMDIILYYIVTVYLIKLFRFYIGNKNNFIISLFSLAKKIYCMIRFSSESLIFKIN